MEKGKNFCNFALEIILNSYLMSDNSLLSRLDGIDARFAEVSTLITDPSVIADMRRYVKLTKEYKDLERLTRTTHRYRDLLSNIDEAKDILANESDADMRAMAREQLDEATTALPQVEEEIKLLLIPADPEDCKNAIVEIRGGTGGDEAAIFAGDLFKMYTKYCESKGWSVAVSSVSEGAAGGYKEIVFAVTGEGVYGTMKYESGVHRVQRVPATETQGRVHTSAATVAVLPEAEEFDVEINEGEIKWDTFRSGGAGGQNVNKVESGVRLRYQFTDPYTGEQEEILIENTETRDQPKNKENAMRQLRSILYDKELQHRLQEQAKIEAGKMKIEWGSQIRSYVFDDRRVKDHRTNYQTSDVGGVMDGDIDAFIKAYLMEFAATEE